MTSTENAVEGFRYSAMRFARSMRNVLGSSINRSRGRSVTVIESNEENHTISSTHRLYPRKAPLPPILRRRPTDVKVTTWLSTKPANVSSSEESDSNEISKRHSPPRPATTASSGSGDPSNHSTAFKPQSPKHYISSANKSPEHPKERKFGFYTCGTVIEENLDHSLESDTRETLCVCLAITVVYEAILMDYEGRTNEVNSGSVLHMIKLFCFILSVHSVYFSQSPFIQGMWLLPRFIIECLQKIIFARITESVTGFWLREDLVSSPTREFADPRERRTPQFNYDGPREIPSFPSLYSDVVEVAEEGSTFLLTTSLGPKVKF